MSQNVGWVKLHRKLLESPLSENPNHLVVWIHLLLRASYGSRKAYFGGKQIVLQPGQLIIGYTKLSEYTGLPRSTCRRAVEAAAKRNAIGTQSEREATLITVLNWESYQERETQADAKRPLYKKKRIKKKELNTNTINTSEAPKFSESAEAYRLSVLLFEKIKELDPKAKMPDFQKWSDHMDKLLRLDSRTYEEIEVLILWIFTEPKGFWATNVLSTRTLREKFSKIWIQARSTISRSKPSHSVIP